MPKGGGGRWPDEGIKRTATPPRTMGYQHHQALSFSTAQRRHFRPPSTHVVVCGHYYCGGVKAAMQSADLGILNPWLRNIRDVYRIHKKELNC